DVIGRELVHPVAAHRPRSLGHRAPHDQVHDRFDQKPENADESCPPVLRLALHRHARLDGVYRQQIPHGSAWEAASSSAGSSPEAKVRSITSSMGGSSMLRSRTSKSASRRAAVAATWPRATDRIALPPSNEATCP